MSSIFEAIYTNGVFQPLEPTHLKEGQKVRLFVENENGAASELLDRDLMKKCAQEADPSITNELVRQALAGIPGALVSDFEAERDERT